MIYCYALSLFFVLFYSIFPIIADKNSSQPDLLSLFCSPISFNESGFRCYIKHRYNRPEYTHFFSLCFDDIINFLDHGIIETREYADRTLKLFHKKIKQTSYIHPQAFNNFLKQLPQLIKKYIKQDSFNTKIEKSITKFFYSYNNTQTTPLSAQLTKLVTQEYSKYEQSISTNELRATLMRFLELAISKLIWNAQDQLETWDSMKELAYYIEQLGKEHIIYQEDLDDLYWSLIARFCYFIELSGAQLSLETYKAIQKDMDSLYFLFTEEQEDYIETKNSYLKRSLKEGAIKAHAHSFGIINS